MNFNEICRLCLRFGEKYVDLNETNGVKILSEELAEKIEFCYSIKVDLSEGLPTKVCHECVQVISYFYIAKKNVIICEQLLRDLLCMTASDIKMESEKQKATQSLLAISNKFHNTMSNDVSNNINHESHNTSNVECKKDTLVSVSSAEVTTNNKQHCDFKLKKKKKKNYKPLQVEGNNKLLKPLNMIISKPKVSMKFKVLKPLRNQPKRSSKSFKVAKETSKTNENLKEFVNKKIGALIDTSNILSPNVKRLRKTVVAKKSLY